MVWREFWRSIVVALAEEVNWAYKIPYYSVMNKVKSEYWQDSENRHLERPWIFGDCAVFLLKWQGLTRKWKTGFQMFPSYVLYSWSWMTIQHSILSCFPQYDRVGRWGSKPFLWRCNEPLRQKTLLWWFRGGIAHDRWPLGGVSGENTQNVTATREP